MADQKIRVVNVSDTTKPVITLVGDSEMRHEQGTEYIDAGATAVDNIDGDITSSITVSSDVDINIIGTYLVTYNVSDTAGNQADQKIE